jgi:hypothetical protein
MECLTQKTPKSRFEPPSYVVPLPTYFYFGFGKPFLHFRYSPAWGVVEYTKNGMPDPENPTNATGTALLS